MRIHVSVVEGACQNRHRSRADAAAVDEAFVIATLPGRNTTNDQPDNKQHRSNVHLDLRLKKRILPSDRMAVTLVVIHEEAYPCVSAIPFPEIWKLGQQRNSAELIEAIGMSGLHFHDLRRTGSQFARQQRGRDARPHGPHGHDSARAAMIYQHEARGADKALTDAIDAHVTDEQHCDDGDDGRREYRLP